MEGYEHLVKVSLEAEGLIVSSNLKFPVTKKTRKSGGEKQTHGYEVDLVGARRDLLVLASVKSFFGSTGVRREGFQRLVKITNPTPRQQRHFNLYKLFNDKKVREGVIAGAAERFGYSPSRVELRLYAGKFQNEAAKNDITAFLAQIQAGKGPVKVFGLAETLAKLLTVLESKTYFNDPVIMTLKAFTERLRQVKGKNGKKINMKKAVNELHEILNLQKQ